MSQVEHMEIEESLEELVSRLPASAHVVVAKGPLGSRVLVEVHLPRETHFKKISESTYTEHVSEFEVLEVLRSSSLRPGERFWVWHEPAYDLKATRAYHETGFSRSPVIQSRSPVHAPRGEERVLCLEEKANDQGLILFHELAVEGFAARDELARLLAPKRRGFWPFRRG